MKINKFKKKATRRYVLKKKREWRNPLFNNSKSVLLWNKLNKIFFLFIIIILIYFVFFSPLFAIKNIVITGSEEYDKNIIKNAIYDQQQERVIYY